jgi:predicted DNA-binding transcriptional regulator YafY
LTTDDRVRWTGTRSSLERLVAIHTAISSGRWTTASAIAADLGVSQRTIERDIEFLRDRMRAPIRFDKRARKYYYEHPFMFPTLTFTEGEMIVFFLGEMLLNQWVGSPYETYIRSAMDKIKLAMSAEVRLSPDELQKLVSFRAPCPRGDQALVASHYSAIFRAIEQHRVIRIRYTALSSCETTEREVDPYHLTVREGACYLIAYCHLRRSYRVFALDRMEFITVTGETFIPDASFDADSFLSSSWGLEKGDVYEVVVRFDSQQSRYIRERTWHSTQRIVELQDGGLEFHVAIEGLGEIKRWVMQFGSHAEVLKPPELREAVSKEVAAMWDAYCGQNPVHNLAERPSSIADK